MSMGTTTFTCRRPDCNSTLEAGDVETELRCNLCGTKHKPPWDDPQADLLAGTPQSDGGVRAAEDDVTPDNPETENDSQTASNTVTVDAGDGEPVRIEFNVHIHRHS